MGEARTDLLEARLDRLEEDVREIKTRLARVEEVVIRIDERLNTILPTLATKAELAEKPSRLYMWGVMAALTGAYTAALAAIGVLLTYLPAHH